MVVVRVVLDDVDSVRVTVGPLQTYRGYFHIVCVVVTEVSVVEDRDV